MENDAQTLDTDIDESIGDEDGGDNQPDEVLGKLEEVTGRKFKDQADFEKHYKSLSSFVGEGNDAKKKFNEILESVKPEAEKAGVEPEELLRLKLANPTSSTDDLKERVDQMKTGQQEQEKLDRVAKLEAELEEMQFKSEFPDLVTSLPILKDLAKARGITLKEVASDSNIKDLLNASRNQGSSVVQTNQKVAGTSESSRLKKQAMDGDQNAIVDFLKQPGMIKGNK